MLDLSTILSIVCFLSHLIINGGNLVYPTISNSTGDYFISSHNQTFNEQELICLSNKSCHIYCMGWDFCYKTIMNCNNTSICNINCERGEDDISVAGKNPPCFSSAIHTSPMETNIHCGTTCSSITIYADYDKYPSSETTLTCDNGCRGIWLKNPLTMMDNYDYVTYERFKIFCVDYCFYNGRWVISTFPFNTLAPPSIYNETGEYYLPGLGSRINIQCSHDKLCHIDCGYGDCFDNNIDCGNSSICTIQCNNDYGCRYLGDIKANDIRQFNLECMGVNTCNSAEFNLTNIEAINMNCNGGGSCDNNLHHINMVDQLSVECGDSACDPSPALWDYTGNWILTDMDNVTFTCHDGCDQIGFVIKNSSYIRLSCIQGSYSRWPPCKDITIDAIGSEIDIICEADFACADMNICTDETLNIDCIGYNTCSPLDICDTINTTADTNINCDGQYSCINERIPSPRPTLSPVPTLKPTPSPSFRPSLSPIQMTINEQEQESATNSPFKTWEIIVLSIVIVFILIMIMYLKVFSGKKIEYQKANWDEVETGIYEK